MINNFLKRKRKETKIIKDKSPSRVKGLKILLNLEKRHYLAAYLKTYKYMLKNLEECFHCVY